MCRMPDLLAALVIWVVTAQLLATRNNAAVRQVLQRLWAVCLLVSQVGAEWQQRQHRGQQAGVWWQLMCVMMPHALLAVWVL